MHITPLRATGVLVTIAWVLAVIALLRHEGLLGAGEAPVLLAGSALDQPYESWLGLYVGEPTAANRVGAVHVQRLPERRPGSDGQEIDGTTHLLSLGMQLQLFGRTTEMRVAASLWAAPSGDPVEVSASVVSGEANFRVEGVASGGNFRGQMSSNEMQQSIDVPLPPGARLDAGIGTNLSFPVLDVGEQIWIDSFDPMTMKPSRAHVRCVAHETLTIAGESWQTRRLQVRWGGLENTAWIDEAGDVVRALTPLGLLLQRESTPIQGTGVGSPDLLGLTAVQPTGERPFRGARSMTISVRGGSEGHNPERDDPGSGDPGSGNPGSGNPDSGDPGSGNALPSSGPQQRLPGDANSDHRFRIEAVAAADGDPPELDQLLRSDPFVQSEDERIRTQAREIIGDATDVEERAERISTWLYESIEKVPVLSVPSAVDVLRERKGDCNEHTVLFAALARAVDVPTRIALGLVWSEDLDGFYYHAWPEVWTGDGWRWLDPTLGQTVADATHIKLLHGGIETWPQLLPFLGALEIDVEEIQ